MIVAESSPPGQSQTTPKKIGTRSLCLNSHASTCLRAPKTKLFNFFFHFQFSSLRVLSSLVLASDGVSLLVNNDGENASLLNLVYLLVYLLELKAKRFHLLL